MTASLVTLAAAGLSTARRRSERLSAVKPGVEADLGSLLVDYVFHVGKLLRQHRDTTFNCLSMLRFVSATSRTRLLNVDVLAAFLLSSKFLEEKGDLQLSPARMECLLTECNLNRNSLIQAEMQMLRRVDFDVDFRSAHFLYFLELLLLDTSLPAREALLHLPDLPALAYLVHLTEAASVLVTIGVDDHVLDTTCPLLLAIAIFLSCVRLSLEAAPQPHRHPAIFTPLLITCTHLLESSDAASRFPATSQQQPDPCRREVELLQVCDDISQFLRSQMN